MVSSVKVANKPRIKFNYNAYRHGPMGDVFEYLLNSRAHSTPQGKQKGLAAISAFWKPFSAQAVLRLSEEEVRAVALTSIEELTQQISLIRNTFNLPEEPVRLTKADVERIVKEQLDTQMGRAANKEPAARPPIGASGHPRPSYLESTSRVVT